MLYYRHTIYFQQLQYCDVGYISQGATQSLTSIALNNEIISLVKRLLKSYNINDNTVPLEVIEEVGPRGEFLTHEHTAENFSEQLWEPDLISRDNYSNWKSKGSKTMQERAEDKVKEIIASKSSDESGDDSGGNGLGDTGLGENGLSDNELGYNELSDNELSDNELGENELGDNELSDNELGDNKIREINSFIKEIEGDN